MSDTDTGRPTREQVDADLARADLVHDGGTNEVRLIVHRLAAEVRALRAEAEQVRAETPEPDAIEDGIEIWEIPGDLHVERDGTSRLHGPTYCIGGRDVSAAGVRRLRDALNAVLARDEEASHG